MGTSLTVSAQSFSIGLCVIAKNAQDLLPFCLASVRDLVNAMVVIDTGSTDATPEVAVAGGARCVRFAWTNDFAAARNAGLAEMSTDWVLVLDADEELDGAAHAWIRAELRAPRADGYVVPIRNYLQPWDEPMGERVLLNASERHPRASDARLFVPSRVCRLFRRHPDVYYDGHVHEQVEYRMLQLGMPIADAGFFVHHFGWYLIEAEQAQRKFALYRELLAAKLQQRPEDPQVLMQYGDALCNHDGRPEEGLACFMKAAQLHPEYTEIWAHIAPALLRLGHLEAALIAIGQIPSTSASAGRRSQLRGEVFAAMGRWAEAAEAYATALQHYPGYVGLTAKLGLVQTVAGDTKAGEDHLQTAIASAERAAERAPGALSFQRAAELHAQLRRWPDVLRLTRAGLAYAPTAAALHELTLRAAVAQGELGLAAAAAASLASHASAPRASLRYAAILRQMGAHQAAAAAVREGLARFPDEPSLLRAQQELAQEPNPIAIQMPDPKPHQMPGPADGHIGAAS